MPTKTLICTRSGGELPRLAWDGLCHACHADSFRCPRCRELKPLSENRGSYCRQCRSEYNRAYAARRRGLA